MGWEVIREVILCYIMKGWFPELPVSFTCFFVNVKQAEEIKMCVDRREANKARNHWEDGLYSLEAKSESAWENFDIWENKV